MKDVTRIIQADTDEEALRKGNPLKIYNGKKWLVGIIYQRLDQLGTDKFNIVEVI